MLLTVKEKKVIRKLMVSLLVGAMCLSGAAALAYNEAPMLRVKVAAGELPPVEERLPEEPKVVEPVEEIGQYGGTLYAFATGDDAWQDLTECPEVGSTFVLELAKNAKIVGDLAKGYELSEDAKSLTLYLRKGLKWSDGYPLTADDFLFTWEDLIKNPNVNKWNPLPVVKRIVKVDDYTLRFEMEKPSPGIVLKLTSWTGGFWHLFKAKHYLKKWHIKYNPNANELAKKEGFVNWWKCLSSHYMQGGSTADLDEPTVKPWVLTEHTTTYRVFERNPYFYQVDKEGNQLPYVDKIVVQNVDKEVYQMKVIDGQASVAVVNTDFENYSLYKKNEEKGGYRTIPVPGLMGTDVAFGINQNSSDPFKRKIYQNIKFRRALSLAINRKEVNNAVYYGQAVPRQATILPSTSYYKKEWGESYAQYDPEESNRLLDEIGLTKRNKDGFRLRPDGKPLLLRIEFGEIGFWAIPITSLELVKEYWENIGLKVQLKPQTIELFEETRPASEHDIRAIRVNGEEIHVYIVGVRVDWTEGGGEYAWGSDWADWLKARDNIKKGEKTLEDYGGKLPGEEPPEKIKKLFEWGKNLAPATKMGSKEYREVFQKIFDSNMENLYIIGVVGMSPVVFIAKNDIGNVYKAFPPGSEWGASLYYDAQQYFFKR